MINGGYPETPDAWIERTDEDRYGYGERDPDEYEPNEDAQDWQTCASCGCYADMNTHHGNACTAAKL